MSREALCYFVTTGSKVRAERLTERTAIIIARAIARAEHVTVDVFRNDRDGGITLVSQWEE